MSIRLLTDAFRARAGSPTAKLVLLKLADNASDQGYCWPSVTHIAHETELSVRAVQEHIKSLEAKGVLVKEVRFDGNGRQRSNGYFINLAPLLDGEGAGGAPRGALGAGGRVQEVQGEGAGGAPLEPSVNHHFQPSEGGEPDFGLYPPVTYTPPPKEQPQTTVSGKPTLPLEESQPSMPEMTRRGIHRKNQEDWERVKKALPVELHKRLVEIRDAFPNEGGFLSWASVFIAPEMERLGAAFEGAVRAAVESYHLASTQSYGRKDFVATLKAATPPKSRHKDEDLPPIWELKGYEDLRP